MNPAGNGVTVVSQDFVLIFQTIEQAKMSGIIL